MSSVVAYLREFSKLHILVVGDLMVDHYIWGSVRRISPEAPVPVVETTSESVMPGGAANVLHNVLALGGCGTLIGRVGADESGRWLLETLKAKGAICDGVWIDSALPTTRKTRVIAHQQHVVRFDRETRAPLSSKGQRFLRDALSAQVTQSHCIVVSDYAKGVMTQTLFRRIFALANQNNIPLIVDPKPAHASQYRNATLITPNQQEAAEASGVTIIDEATLCRAAEILLRKTAAQGILITRGAQGMTLFERGQVPLHIPAQARAVYDVTGAGDTVISTLALARSAGASWADAARLANLAAGLAVEQIGTVAITKNQLEKAVCKKS